MNRLALLGPVALTGLPGASLRRAVQQKRLATLAIVAAAPSGEVSRDRLLGLLWPDRDERIGRHLLADSIYVLRRTLGQDAVVASGEIVRLSSDSVWTDVSAFHAALADERWSRALELYRGDFLDGLLVRNAVEFEQWAMAERDRLRMLATRAASALAASLAAAGRHTEATNALEIAPCDEAVCRTLLIYLLDSGNRARADAVARAFVERLARDIGIAPSAETMRVVRETRAMANAEPILVMSPRTSAAPRRPGTDSTTASIISQGRHHWHQRTRESLERAVRYFTRATERDARADGAWCGLADSWVVLGGRGYMPAADAVERARPFVERALAIDDTSSAAHTSLGGLHLMSRRWSDADAAFRRALQLDARNADAHHWLSLVLLSGFGAAEEAIREQSIAARLNPVSSIQVGSLGWQRYLRGEYDLSRANMEPTVDLNAELEEGHAGLARAAARLGDEAGVNAAIAAGVARRRDLAGDLLAEHASALAVLGRTRDARGLARKAAARGAMPVNLALAWASIGDVARAFECLERESFLVYWAPQAVWWDPRFDTIRDYARFKHVRARVQQVWRPEWL
jgi:DNA-binding SARP family transcriptional activator